MAGMRSSKQVVSVGRVPAAPYSTAVAAGGLIYVSGTLAQDAHGRLLHPGDVGAQTRIVLERMRGVLDAAGSSIDHVVAATVYLTSASDFEAMNQAYRPFWPGTPPTRTTIITGLVLPGALVEITMVAVPSGAERTVVHPDGWPASPNPYSYAIRSGDTLFMSGLVPRRGRDNTVVTGDIAAQSRAVLENAAEVLGAAGLSFANVVNARVYLTSTADFRRMNEVYREFAGDLPPTRATVQAGLAGSGYLVEMTFTATSAAREAVGTPPVGVPLTPAIRAGRRLYVSGMLGNTPSTRGDVTAQTEETLTRIRQTLAAAGASPLDVAEATVYLTSADAFAAMNEVYRRVFEREFPARATVVTPLVVEDGLVEIMVTAYIPPR